MRQLGYHVYDVFTDRRFSGNQLGVVPDASGLSGEIMQSIARELNLSETIFFLPPDNPAHAAKVRIFMPLGELPFAGHPTIGGAIAYAGSAGLPDEAEIVLEEGVGPVRCRVSATADGGRSAFDAARIPVELEFGAGDDAVASALGLERDDLDFGLHHVVMVTGGVPYVTVPVKGLEALGKARVNAEAWLALDIHREGKAAAPYLYCRDGEAAFRVRMFAPWDGIPEDPATGSAAVAFAAALKRFECRTDGAHRFRLTQGVEMGRRSEIGLSVEIERDAIANVRISGHAVKSASGTLFVPE